MNVILFFFKFTHSIILLCIILSSVHMHETSVQYFHVCFFLAWNELYAFTFSKFASLKKWYVIGKLYPHCDTWHCIQACLLAAQHTVQQPKVLSTHWSCWKSGRQIWPWGTTAGNTRSTRQHWPKKTVSIPRSLVYKFYENVHCCH